MKIGIKRLLEKRFGEWSAGTTLAALSAATLLGLCTPTAAPALDGGPPSDTITLTTPGALPGSSAGGLFTISDCQTLGCSGPPTFFVSPGATVDLLGITNFIATNNASGPATLIINFNYQFTAGAIPPNPATSASFGASMAGAFITNPGSVSYTAAGFNDVINKCARTDTSCGDSFAAGAGPTLTSFNAPDNLLVEDDLLCPPNSDSGCLPLFQGTIKLSFANTGDQVLIPGSFREAAGSTANKPLIIDALTEVPAPPTALLVILGAAAAIAGRRRLSGERA